MRRFALPFTVASQTSSSRLSVLFPHVTPRLPQETSRRPPRLSADVHEYVVVTPSYQHPEERCKNLVDAARSRAAALRRAVRNMSKLARATAPALRDGVDSAGFCDLYYGLKEDYSGGDAAGERWRSEHAK